MSILDAIPRTYEQIGEANALRARSGLIYGQALADIGTNIASLPAQFQQRRSMALREQEAQLQLHKAQREEAADQALQNAFASGAVNPDGTLNQQFLVSHLAGTPAAPRIPAVIEGLTRMQEMGKQLQVTSGHAAESEDDILGGYAHSALLAETPHDQAGVFLAGVAAAQKQGSVSPERAKAAIASFMGQDGAPDETKVPTALKGFVQGSKTQRQLAEGEERASSLADERKDREFTTQLGRYANQLASAPDQSSYTRRYAGIDPKFQSYFDSPDEWTSDSAKRAGQATMRPQDRIAEARVEEQIQRDKNTSEYQRTRETRLDKLEEARVASEQASTQTAKARLKLEQDRENRLAGRTPGGTDTDFRHYTQWVTQYNKARTEERLRAPSVSDPKNPLAPPTKQIPPEYPPPSLEKWQVMTPQERSATMANPNMRINDAEMARRLGGDTAPESTPSTPATPAALAQSAPEARTLTPAQLDATARRLGISTEDAAKQAQARGYTLLR